MKSLGRACAEKESKVLGSALYSIFDLGKPMLPPSHCLILSIWETKIIVLLVEKKKKGRCAINFFEWELFVKLKD